MKTITQTHKTTLHTWLKKSKLNKVYHITYNPNTVGKYGGTKDPEGDAVRKGLVLYSRETSSNLVEAIYTSGVVA